MIELTKVNHGFIVSDEANHSLFVQSDNEFPGLATTFGWYPEPTPMGYTDSIHRGPHKCYHLNTDGTVDCSHCGKKAGDMISEAYDFLCENIGKVADDPGYF